ncbi:hypothetical protein LMH87_005493 [Akanthomyces muscarius]|uniref:Uncharacterized protein n=1 Tax=Akanthomyces muscarius TaxID=2231603 RepID=A0A9W8QLX6_AKAMU|nr:hypothetical protein LMH87_005493 [Akanthomyces muscarius]KAJ4163785.1 hypothetical protein LMH87_005493 [Akanthomyces muscarius]
MLPAILFYLQLGPCCQDGRRQPGTSTAILSLGKPTHGGMGMDQHSFVKVSKAPLPTTNVPALLQKAL